MVATLSKRTSATARTGNSHARRPPSRGEPRAVSPLTALQPPTLVLNAALQVLAQVGADATPYLRRTDWRPGERIEVILQPWLLPAFLRLTIPPAPGMPAAEHLPAPVRVQRPGRAQQAVELQLRRDEGLLFLTLARASSARRVGAARPGMRVGAGEDGTPQALGDARAAIAHLTDALAQAHAETERISKAMHDSNQQLAHANDALEAMNEELLGANERLTRSGSAFQAINAELNGILANLGFATFLVDASLTLRRFNPGASMLFGIQNGDIGRPFAPRIATIDALVPRLRQCIECNETATFQVHRDGRYLLVQINLVADARQACTGAIVSCIDETSVRAAEQTLDRQLRQSQKMQAMGQLTGGIAHDFNNILASIMGHADLLARTLGDDEDLPAAAPRHLGEILRASERARSLIQQLLLYSHGGGGRPEPIEVPRLIEASLSMLRSVFPATIELRTHHPASLPCVLIDPVQANQLVMNLAINARDALQGRGLITLGADVLDTGTLRCASCHADHGGRYVRLRVSDNGPGLGEGTLDRAFEPFFTTKDIGQGTGLGLAVVHGIVHEHGGHIQISSGSDGATFDLLLPVIDATPHSGNAGGNPVDAQGYLPRDAFDQPHHAAGDAPSVLIVDDEVQLADMMRELLGIHGYRASACHDAEAALELLREQDFGCVLSDLTMPGMSGTEFAAALLQVRPEVPLCLYTGNRLLVDEHSLARLPNVRALLDKPVETRTLLQTLRALCGHAAAH
jgi:signal transduction histidine kinase